MKIARRLLGQSY